MDNILAVHIAESFQQLNHNCLDAALLAQMNLLKRRPGDQFHNQPAHSFSHVDVEGFIFDDVGMFKSLHQQEVRLKSWQVFFLYLEFFHCELFLILFSLTTVDNSIGSLSNFIQKFVFALKRLLNVFKMLVFLSRYTFLGLYSLTRALPLFFHEKHGGISLKRKCLNL